MFDKQVTASILVTLKRRNKGKKRVSPKAKSVPVPSQLLEIDVPAEPEMMDFAPTPMSFQQTPLDLLSQTFDFGLCIEGRSLALPTPKGGVPSLEMSQLAEFWPEALGSPWNPEEVLILPGMEDPSFA